MVGDIRLHLITVIAVEAIKCSNPDESPGVLKKRSDITLREAIFGSDRFGVIRLGVTVRTSDKARY